MKKIKPQYSGNRSRKIWDMINSFKGARQRTLYACFCLLQNMEGSCLTWLDNALKAREYERKRK